MKKIVTSLLAVIALTISAQALVISNFGSAASAAGSSGFVYTAATSVLSGTEAGGDAVFNASPLTLNLVNAVTTNGVTLTASATTAPTSSFSITLSDNTGKVLIATGFKWTDFLSGPKTVTKLFTTLTAGFNYTTVTDFSIDSAGSTQPINITLTQLQSASPIPEPATYALAGLSGLGMVLVARRRKVA